MRTNTPLTIVGNLTADPDLRFTPKGHPIVKFTIAVNERRFDPESKGWVDDDPSFYQCQAWRQLAENIAGTLTKGNRAIVTGVLKQQHWKTSEGENRSSWVLNVDTAGPSLEYHTATLSKVTRIRGDEGPPDDEWATATPDTPASA